MKKKQIPIVLALAVAGACSPGKPISEAKPATGETLAIYSREISRSVDTGKNADLVQRFCKNITGDLCPTDIKAKLEAYGFSDGSTGVDMAYAFAVTVADQKDETRDKQSTDDDFLAAAYRVALAREPDTEGAVSNLDFLKQGGERKMMLRSLLESTEFKNLQ